MGQDSYYYCESNYGNVARFNAVKGMALEDIRSKLLNDEEFDPDEKLVFMSEHKGINRDAPIIRIYTPLPKTRF